MRKTAIITASLPHSLVKTIERYAEKNAMTRSELFRSAIRQYLEYEKAEEAIAAYEHEKRKGGLIKLKGTLADIML